MEKNTIKTKLREGLLNEFRLDTSKPKPTHQVKQWSKDKGGDKEETKEKGSDLNNKSGEGGKKDYSDVTHAFEKLGGPSMVDVMQLTGIPDDEKGVNRSLFRKKVKQIKNKDTGSYYQFNDEELNQVRAALDIKK